jgi:hypothetical protein
MARGKKDKKRLILQPNRASARHRMQPFHLFLASNSGYKEA